MDQFFPPPSPHSGPQPSDTSLLTRKRAPLTNEEVSEALKSCQDDSAPGPSQVPYKAIKWTWEAHSHALWYLYSNCIELGHYPSPFKASLTAVTSKPNKKDYTDPSSFRPIQLTECAGKVLDKIVAKRIQFEVACNDIVPGAQFGGRSHSSTFDAGLSLTQDIHNAWDKGLKSTALMFDITGFFNFINHEILTQRLTILGFNPTVISLVRGFLSGRHTQISSPLSPILSILYSAPLLNIRELTLHGVTSLAYIDDGVLLTSSSSLSINTSRLQNAYPILEKFLTDNGLCVQPKKLEIMHFTRGPDKENPSFQLPGLERPIIAPKSLRWLGFHLDRHLHFTHHSRILAAKATKTIRAMRILGNTVKGMSHPQLRTLTLSTIVPILTYGCQLWWGRKFAKSNTKRLQTALNGALRLICRGFSSTPVTALQHIAHIPPIELSIHKLCYSSSIRLHRLLLSNPTFTKIPLSRPTINLHHLNSLTNLCPDT